MPEIVKLTLADALLVVSNMREQDRRCARAVLGPVSDEVFASNRWQTNGPAWALLDDNAPVAIFGLSMAVPWLAVAWLVATPAMTSESWRKLMRHCRTVLANAKASKVHRLEAHVIEGWAEAERFARGFCGGLGFVHEGTRHRAGRDGENIQVWSMTA